MKYVASISFGKDSLAMLIKIIQNKLPLDEVVFFNTGMEFEPIYSIRNKVIKVLNEKGIKYTELKPKRPFIDTMINYPHIARNGTIKSGYGWCGGRCRWGTTEKITTIDKYCKDSIQYVGIAYDEIERYKRLPKNKIAPLVELKMTEKDCLELCYSMGITWNGLYNYLKRVSCWCCRNKNLQELKNIYKYDYITFRRLIYLESVIGEPMKKNHTLVELKDKWEKEVKYNECTKECSGKNGGC